ncbi:MAG: hypothetical protein H6969_11325 [Gammaproteobacteria bacterium]|nr:hypothetical protein [Gammaproteobacteria bacterium]
MKTNISACILTFTLTCAGFHPVLAQPFNQEGQGLDINPPKTVPSEPVRYNTMLYNARYTRSAQDKTPPIASFNNRFDADRADRFPERSVGREQVNCDISDPTAFNNRDIASC